MAHYQGLAEGSRHACAGTSLTLILPVVWPKKLAGEAANACRAEGGRNPDILLGCTQSRSSLSKQTLYRRLFWDGHVFALANGQLNSEMLCQTLGPVETRHLMLMLMRCGLPVKEAASKHALALSLTIVFRAGKTARRDEGSRAPRGQVRSSGRLPGGLTGHGLAETSNGRQKLSWAQRVVEGIPQSSVLISTVFFPATAEPLSCL